MNTYPTDEQAEGMRRSSSPGMVDDALNVVRGAVSVGPALKQAMQPTPRGDPSGGTGPDSEAMARAAVRNGTSVAAAPPLPAIASVSAQGQPTIEFTPYASKPPASTYDDDIEFTGTLAKMAAAAGLADKALGMRDLNMKLQLARTEHGVDEAQRAFIAGDVTKGIDVMNHMLPNGRKVMGYSAGKDGKSYSFQMEDKSTITKTADELSSMFAVMRDPKVLGTMLINRAKTAAEMQGRSALEGVKHYYNLQEAIAKGIIDETKAMKLAEYNRTHGKNSTHVSMTGEVFVDKADGTTVKIVEAPDPLNPKGPKVMREIPVTKNSAPAQGAPAASGYPINRDFVARALAPQ